MNGWISHVRVEYELGWVRTDLLPLPVVKEPVPPCYIMEESDKEIKTHPLDYHGQ